MKRTIRLITIVCLIVCVLFFLPYIKLDKGLLDQFDDAVDMLGNYNPVVDQTSGIRVKDIRGMSTFRFARVVYALDSSDETGAAIFDIIFFAIFIGVIVLGIVFANTRHPLLVIFSGVFLAVGNSVFHAYAYGRFININAYGYPVQIYHLSIACYGYYICAAAQIVLGICLFIDKRKLRSGVITEGTSGDGFRFGMGKLLEKLRSAVRKKTKVVSWMCPHCGRENDINNQFCIYCGKPLMPDTDDTKGGVSRVCPNGHIYSDPLLTVCPECGMPLSGGPTPPGSDHHGDDYHKDDHDKDVHPEPEKADIPDWMRPPRDDDLNPKH